MNAIEYLQRIANAGVPIKLFNQSYGRYVFVSNDEIRGDNIVEAHPPAGEHRNPLLLEHTGEDRFFIYTPPYNKWLFASNDTRAGDNIIEAHTRKDDGRNVFVFQPVNPDEFGRFKIYTAHYNKWLFVSNDMEGPDNVVEAHSDPNQARNVFDVVLPDPVGYVLKDVVYDLGAATVETSVPVDAGTVGLDNTVPSTLGGIEAEVGREVEETAFWSSHWYIRGDVVTKVSAGIPLLINGSVTVSAEFFYENTQAGKHSEKRTVKQKVRAEHIPPGTPVVCDWVIFKNSLSVPYTGTLITDYGGPKVETPVSGLFTGLVQSSLRATLRPA